MMGDVHHHGRGEDLDISIPCQGCGISTIDTQGGEYLKLDRRSVLAIRKQMHVETTLSATFCSLPCLVSWVEDQR